MKNNEKSDIFLRKLMLALIFFSELLQNIFFFETCIEKGAGRVHHFCFYASKPEKTEIFFIIFIVSDHQLFDKFCYLYQRQWRTLLINQ